MPTELKLRGGTTTQHATFTGAHKEVTVDTTKKTLVLHDGATAGGHELARADLSNVEIMLTDISGVNITSPSNGQVLKYNGTNWVNGTDSTGGGGSGMASRVTATVTTTSLAASASGNYVITGFKGYALYSIEVDHAAWVTVYTSTAARTADASRAITTDPTPGSGVIAEAITTGASKVSFTPGTFGYSDETSPSTDIPIKVVNQGGSSTTITVTLTLLQLEA